VDSFLAAPKDGQAWNSHQSRLHTRNGLAAREVARHAGRGNVEFRLGEVEHPTVESGSFDVVISNCVIDLSPDKDAALR